MSEPESLEVLTLLHPDLLPAKDLVDMIKSRCCHVQNLDALSKEDLVELFRQVILPLPQRFYRTNRRGKMLTSRRAKASLECSRKRGKEEARSSEGENVSKISRCEDRLGLPPNVHKSEKVRIFSGESPYSRSTDSVNLDKIIINERSRHKEMDGKVGERREDSPSAKKVTLKRSSTTSEDQSFPRRSSTEGKKQRTVIKWP